MKKKSADLSKKVLASALSAAMVVAFAPAVALGDGTDDDVSGGHRLSPHLRVFLRLMMA